MGLIADYVRVHIDSDESNDVFRRISDYLREEYGIPEHGKDPKSTTSPMERSILAEYGDFFRYELDPKQEITDRELERERGVRGFMVVNKEEGEFQYFFPKGYSEDLTRFLEEENISHDETNSVL